MLRMGFASNIPSVGSIKLTTCPKLGGPAETSTPSSAISGSAPGMMCSPAVAAASFRASIWSNSSSLLSSLDLPCFWGLEAAGLVAGPGFGWAEWGPCLLRPFSSSIDFQFTKIWPIAPVASKFSKVSAGHDRRAAPLNSRKSPGTRANRRSTWRPEQVLAEKVCVLPPMKGTRSQNL